MVLGIKTIICCREISTDFALRDSMKVQPEILFLSCYLATINSTESKARVFDIIGAKVIVLLASVSSYVLPKGSVLPQRRYKLLAQFVV